MPTWSGKKSAVALHPNCEQDGKYEAEYGWKKSQFYQGECFRDSIHGQGTYRWEDLSVFEGSFYSNHKEGYASVSFRDNCCFEGLFVRNKPFGPGIYTYANGRQDAGFWMGRKLVRLSRAADYIIPRLAPTSAAKIKLLQFRRLIPLDDLRNSADDILEKYGYLSEHFGNPYSTLIYDPRSIFFDKHVFEKTYFMSVGQPSKEFCRSPIGSERERGDEGEKVEGLDPFKSPIPPTHCLCSREVFEMTYAAQDAVDVCERDSTTDGDSQTGILYNLTKYGAMERPLQSSEDEKSVAETDAKGEEDDATEERSKVSKIVSWNRSELCTEMLKQIFRYRAFEDKLNFNLAKLMIGARTAFRRTGLREKECLHFLKMCSLGPPNVIRDLLCSYQISEELMDARGNNGLMFAAATDQLDIIDILLDFGVDVNAFNDEGLTPLNLCLLRRLAQANNISNWEAAFLPKEIDQTLVPENDGQGEAWECRESIPSLDRVFGDGMSMNDSNTMVFDNRFPSPPITSPSLTKDHSERSTARANRNVDDSKDNSTMSQITVLNLVKSPKSLVDNSTEDIAQTLQSNRSQTVSNRSRPLGSNDPTPKPDAKIVVKSNKREEYERSITKTAADRYLFEFTFEKKPPAAVGGSKKKEGSAKSAKGRGKREEPVKVEVTEEAPDSALIAKIQGIDRTIEKLLRRGADPNISEVPKPSLHLAVHTKDLPTVRSLLVYGACPDSQLYPNEGLLTPLHVLVLLKPSPEFVLICELLLSFGANPEEETHPEFSICEEEQAFLEPDRGRTPLQLLCMRPDVEYADPDDNLVTMALMLARASNARHFYNGHSCLTLAMHSGNLKLLGALLQSRHFDPNDVLGKDLGTALHVLVSTDFQKKTLYETSIKICDLLLEAGADPTKKFKSPRRLVGTCIDYGYREIDAEKEARKGSGPGKKDGGKSEKAGKEKGGGRDHLKDHVRVVEYLKEVTKRNKGDESETESKSTGNENTVKNLKKSGEGGRGVDSSKAYEKGDYRGKATEKSSAVEDGKKRKGESIGTSDESKSKDKGGDGDKAGKTGEKRDKKDGERETGEQKSKQKAVDRDSDGKRDQGKGDDRGKQEKGSKEGAKARQEKVSKEGVKARQEKGSKEWAKAKQKGSKELEKGAGRTESNFLKDKTKPSMKSLSNKACSETFPEKIRQNLLRLFGSCMNIDVNRLLLPYVVLRDGELYYRFQGRGTNQKEQYSLI